MVQLDLYKKFNVKKEYTSIWLFKKIRELYNPQKILYPWCYVHITPSLVFSDVTYVDSFRDTFKFYEDNEVLTFIKKNKDYKIASKIVFHQQSYNSKLPEIEQSFDLIISQYWWFVWHSTKNYLKKWGILACNNSHGDASMASFDPDYKLIAVYNRRSDDKFSISDKDLGEYLIPKKEISLSELKKTMKGIPYTKSPSWYIFKKTN